MNIVIGSLVGKGATANVFDIGDNKVVKLFHDRYPQSAVINEWENSKLLNQIDIPIAKSYEMVTYGDQYGIIYDKINGVSLLDIILQKYEVEKYATIMACMHKKILCKNLPAATSFKSIIQKNIECADGLTIKSKGRLLEILHTLPDNDGLCHGDFHFGNILMAQEGCYIIDFMNVCMGHKYFDIARTVYLIEITPVPANMPDREKILDLKRSATTIYLKEMGINREDLSDWLKVIVAARLSEVGNKQTDEDERETIMKYLSLQGL